MVIESVDVIHSVFLCFAIDSSDEQDPLIVFPILMKIDQGAFELDLQTLVLNPWLLIFTDVSKLLLFDHSDSLVFEESCDWVLVGSTEDVNDLAFVEEVLNPFASQDTEQGYNVSMSDKKNSANQAEASE